MKYLFIILFLLGAVWYIFSMLNELNKMKITDKKSLKLWRIAHTLTSAIMLIGSMVVCFELKTTHWQTFGVFLVWIAAHLAIEHHCDNKEIEL